MQSNYEVPRVEVPGLTEEERAGVEAVREEMDWFQRTKSGFLTALLAKGRPYIGKAKPPHKPTKHQRHMAKMRVRAEHVRLQRAMDEYAENTTPGGTWIGETV